MQTTWIQQSNNKNLIIVVLGWAADPRIVMPKEGFDTVCVYDYRTIEPAWWDGYAEVHLVAWSYGVWAAEHIFRGREFATATAINGTPLPTDDRFGIPQRVFDLTLANIERVGTAKFKQRICNQEPIPDILLRDDSQTIPELRTLAESFKVKYIPQIRWTRAIIGLKDLIFAPSAQQEYWQTQPNCTIETLAQMPHYPFGKL